MKPDPDKVKAIVDIPTPTDKADVRRLLGMINFLASHMPNMSATRACLLQQGKPTAYASRSLTSSESNYAQIEKELLVIVFAFDKFHQFIYGFPTKVHSDHKPLESIVTKPLCSVPPRLQRMLLRLQKYDLAVKYVSGKSLHVANTLSRAHACLQQFSILSS